MSNKKDFRNIQQTQLDRGQVIKGSFSELNSALRTVGTNSILKDVYTNFYQTYDDQDRLIKVEYYQALSPTIDEITFISDVSSSLQGTYIKLTESLTNTEYVLYNVVNGIGNIPEIGNFQ